MGAVLLACLAAPVAAQTPEVIEDADAPPPPPLEQAPLVYLDCRRCPDTHIRSEIDFVNYVREASAAQVHVIITDQQTGGGTLYTLALIGRNVYSGLNQTLTYVSRRNETEAQLRDGLTDVLRIGLVPYVARTRLADRLRISFERDGLEPAQVVNDSWHNWTFEVYGGGNYDAETSQDSWSARYGFYANRVTDEWKVRLRPYFNHNSRTIRQADEDDIEVRQKRHGFESYLIRSLGGHMGAGVSVDYLKADIENVRHGLTVTPAVEYSLYPYAEATRRAITVTYRLGYEFNDYLEETIYEKTEEALANHSLHASVQFRQPWGSIATGVAGSSYLHDSKFHRITVNSFVSFRLGGGVSLNVGGNYQRINDQLNLPRGEASIEDILLQRRRLATAYRGSGSIGLSYTFGSKFSNVVNPRL